MNAPPVPRRPRWHRRLSVRLFLLGAAAIGICVGTTVGLARWGTTSRLERISEDAAQATAEVQTLVVSGRLDPASVAGAGATGEAGSATVAELLPVDGLEADALPTVGELASSGDRRTIVVDGSGQVTSDSAGELVGVAASRVGLDSGLGSSLTALPDGGFVLTATGRGAAASVTDTATRLSLIGGGIAAAVVALLAWMAGRRLLRPVDDLAEAAARIEAGDASARYEGDPTSQLGLLGASFNSMAARLERDEELRRTLVSDVAHELRTPIGNLRGYLEALTDGVLGPEPELLSSLHAETLALTRLVDDLQDLSQLEAGVARMEVGEVDLGVLAEHAVQAAGVDAADRGVALRCVVDDDLPPIRGDGDRLAQILRNLVSNAVRHAAGEVRVRVEAGDSEVVRLTVADDGDGFDADTAAHLFDRFWRADESRDRATGGSGLGLAIVARLVDAHDGRIEARSDGPGRGACFEVTLPVAQRATLPT